MKCHVRYPFQKKGHVDASNLQFDHVGRIVYIYKYVKLWGTVTVFNTKEVVFL